MRIQELGSAGPTPEVRRANQAALPQQPSSEHIASDQSDISVAASVASQGIDDRDGRVAELRQQYLTGSYQPDASKVAAKIVDEHLD